MINKLFLVRTADIDSSLTDRAGVQAFLKGKPIPISPLTWREEDGLSHWGFILGDIRPLKVLKDLEAWVQRNASNPESPGITLHDYDPEKGVEDTLSGLGLRVNEAGA